MIREESHHRPLPGMTEQARRGDMGKITKTVLTVAALATAAAVGGLAATVIPGILDDYDSDYVDRNAWFNTRGCLWG